MNALVQVVDNLILSGSYDGIVREWYTNSSSIIARTSLETEDSLTCLVNLKSRQVAVGHSNGIIKIWSLKFYTRYFTLRSSDKSKIMFIKDLNNDTIISGSYSGKISLWNTKNGKLINSIETADSLVSICIVSNVIFITGHSSGLIKVWDLKQGSLLNEIKINENKENRLYTQMELSKDYRYIGFAFQESKSSGIDLIDILDQVLTLILTNDHISSLAVLKNGYLVAGDSEGFVKIYNSTKLVQTLNCKSKIASLIELRNRDLLVGTSDGTISLWKNDQDYESNLKQVDSNILYQSSIFFSMFYFFNLFNIFYFRFERFSDFLKILVVN